MDNENKRFKQINRVATPIKVSENNSINNTNVNLPNNDNNNKNNKKRKVKKSRKKLKIKATTIYQSVIGLMFISIIVLAINLIEPDKILKRHTLKYNDIKTTEPANIYPFSEKSIGASEYLTEATNIYINEFFDLSLISNNSNNLDLIVNGKKIASVDKVLTKVGFVDDLIIIGVENNSIRTTRLFVIDASGQIVTEFYQLGGVDGLTLISGNDTITYNNLTAVLKGTSVFDDKVYFSNNLGNNVSTTICSDEELFANSVSLNVPVNAYYTLEYIGAHRFKELAPIYQEKLTQYRENNHLCN